MNQTTTDNETILRGVLDGWKAAVDQHQPDQVAAHFTDDAIFQGMHPYSVGRAGVAAYYDSQPPGLTVEYQVLETRRSPTTSSSDTSTSTFPSPTARRPTSTSASC
ncbi:nuclear transport factor 2 family protein [Amycolatopsis sp. NPDC051372]|uniref:nuclear transport factor 2 family protein n=1 Tax=Amycolatopsis sp. NPDC051372 TaxID=3155669 RepID=UPI003429858D